MSHITTPVPGKISAKRNVVVLASIAALGGLLFGYDTGVISGAILFIKKDFGLNAVQQGMVVSSVVFGAMIGAAMVMFYADKVGRRTIIGVAAVIFIAGTLAASLAPNLGFLLVSRFILGIAIGLSSSIVPLYISELAPQESRGGLVGLFQLAITVGIVAAYLVDSALAPHEAWRWMIVFGVIPAVVLGIGVRFLPESPRWLVSGGDIGKARGILHRVRDPEDPSTEIELQEIRKNVEREKSETHGWRKLFSRGTRPALYVGLGLAIFQQITGINTVIYYAPTIFQFAGFKSASVAILATAGVGVINVIFTIVGILLVDRVGRRPLLMVGMCGMIVGLLTLGFAFHLTNMSGALQIIAVASLSLYIASFAVSWGWGFWVMNSELYPQGIRGRTMSLVTMVEWMGNFVVSLTFLLLIQHLGKPGTFWLFAAFGVLAFFFTYKLVPETKDRSLEQIEDYWRARAEGKPAEL